MHELEAPSLSLCAKKTCPSWSAQAVSKRKHRTKENQPMLPPAAEFQCVNREDIDIATTLAVAVTPQILTRLFSLSSQTSVSGTVLEKVVVRFPHSPSCSQIPSVCVYGALFLLVVSLVFENQ